MTLPQLSGPQFFFFLACCFVSTFLTVGLRSAIQSFVRKHEPDVWSRFGWSTRPRLMSMRATPRDNGPNAAFFGWLRRQGARELSEKYAAFDVLWRWCRVSQVISITLIVCWLILGLSQLLARHGGAG